MTHFVHLRAHSEFSLKDGLIKASELVEKAAENHQNAIALTDNNAMFNSINFYEEARSEGVKPIIGIDAWIESDVTDPDAPPSKVLFLSQNTDGYKSLMGLVSRAQLYNQKDNVALIKQSWFKETDVSNILVLSGDEVTGEIGRALLADGDANKVIQFYKESFPNNFYLEVQRPGRVREGEWVQKTFDAAVETGVPLVATHPIQFANREDFFSHEVKICIASGESVEDMSRVSGFTRDQYFKTTTEMEELFQDIPEALENAGRIADRCATEIPLFENKLPDFPTPNGEPLDAFFTEESRLGLEERLLVLYPDEKERNERRPEYEQRLKHEVDTIIKMGFPGYFMVVSDFIRWAKDNKIPVGPGRGSGAGSLVAYALKITDLDPLKYGLLFERFLNPDRVSMPDFDVDFESNRRDEVISYVKDKYGELSVTQIATFGTLKAKAVLKGVARALQYNYNFVNSLVKLFPGGTANLNITLEQALQLEPRLQEKYDTDASVKRLLDVSMRLEGAPSNIGMHAGGVVIAQGKISDFSPIYMADKAITQYDKHGVEAAGLVKFDFLGVGMLTVIEKAEQLINQRPEFQDTPFDIAMIPLKNEKVYQAFAEGNSVGVFQFESDGMRAMLKQAKPDCFEDIIALIALYRPGSIGYVSEYCNRKSGNDFEYPHPKLEGILEETYGIMIYQEQVMQTAQIIAGYSLGQADILRRAMGKKKPEEMAQQRSVFEAGALKNGLTLEKATELFDMMAEFALYGFNKSHAAAYALIAYQTAFLKIMYPTEYYAAYLTIDANDSKDKHVHTMLQDARKNNIEILPPDINLCDASFVPVSDHQVRYGLSGIKGIGLAPLEAIRKIREEEGDFDSYFDFFKKVGKSKVSRTHVQALVRVGAFDSLEKNRASLLESMADGLKYSSDLAKKSKSVGTILPELFNDNVVEPVRLKKDGTPRKARKPRVVKVKEVVEVVEPILTPTEPWTQLEQLAQEKIAFGFYFSGHPFEGYQKMLGGLSAALPLSEVDSVKNMEKTYLVAGVVSNVKLHTVAFNGNKMAFLSIDDGTTVKDITIFNSVFLESEDLLKEGQFVAFEARIESDRRGEENGNSMVAETVFSFEDLESKLTKGLFLALKTDKMMELKEITKKHPGAIPVTVYHPSTDKDDRYIMAPLHESFNMSASPECLSELRRVLSSERVVCSFNPSIKFEKKRMYGKKLSH